VHPLRAKRLSTALARRGWVVQRTIDGKPNPVRIWESDESFRAAMSGVRARTLVHDHACYVLYRAALGTRSLTGHVAEVGVYRGGTALLLARAFDGAAEVHLFDTFAGMPATDPRHDLHVAGDFQDTAESDVRRLLSRCRGVILHPGFFPGTATGLEDQVFRFVHVDVDIYRSVLDCAEFFYPRLVPGGVLVFDDYGWSSTTGAREAVDEFFTDRPEVPVYLPTGQALVVRHPG
jgi:O-methyltransferase